MTGVQTCALPISPSHYVLHTLFKEHWFADNILKKSAYQIDVIIQCSQYIHLMGLLLKWQVPKKGFRTAERILVSLQLQTCNKSRREPTSQHLFMWAKRQIAQAESNAFFSCALWGLTAGSKKKPICVRQILELQYANVATGLTSQ